MVNMISKIKINQIGMLFLFLLKMFVIIIGGLQTLSVRLGIHYFVTFINYNYLI